MRFFPPAVNRTISNNVILVACICAASSFVALRLLPDEDQANSEELALREEMFSYLRLSAFSIIVGIGGLVVAHQQEQEDQQANLHQHQR